jgi:hypothetical protein
MAERAREDGPADLFVIGGGINGCGIARDDHRTLRPPTGVVNAALTGWRARSMAKTYEEIERAAKAKKGATKELTDLERTLHEANDLPNTLAEDQAERDHARQLAAYRRSIELTEAGYDEQIVDEKKQAQLERARNNRLHAERRTEITQTVTPDWIETIRAKYKAGAFDQAIVTYIAEIAFNQKQTELDGHKPSDPDEELQARLAEVDEEINAAAQNNESPEAIAYLVRKRQKLEYGE